MTDTPPLDIVGTQTGMTSTWGVVGADRGYITQSTDPNPKLRFPQSITVFDDMRTSDGKIASTLAAITAPILSTRWRVVGDSVRPEVLTLVEQTLGLDEDAKNARRRHGINWGEFLRHALLMLPLGFMPFEKVYSLDEDDGRLWLDELGPRMPSSITEIRVDKRGRLLGVKQGGTDPGLTGWGGVFIPSGADGVSPRRLVMFTNAREGADWAGRSILRAAYKHWHIRDHLLRVSSQAVERNGMGVPVVTYDPDAGPRAKENALALARSIRSGAEAGAAVPSGMAVALLGVQGSVVDAIPLIEYHDRAIAGAALTSFLELGHTGGIGQGNVADVFADVYRTAVEAVIDNIEDTVTRHVIRDVVDFNYGPAEPAPMLRADPVDVETAGAEVLKALTDAGLITPDPDLEAELRNRYGLPAKPEGAPAVPVNAAPAAVAEGDPAPFPVVTAAAEDPDAGLVSRLEQVTAAVTALHARRNPDSV